MKKLDNIRTPDYGVSLKRKVINSIVVLGICWYAKGEKIQSIIISSLIIGVMFKICFSVGLIYFGFKSIIDTLIFVGSIIVIYQKPKNMLISLICGTVLGFIVSGFIYF